MATTTPNFGWPVPTSTDLVKNGATAIEALGDAIDASMADLEGGTTGQILAKNSNTDMDFVWTTPNPGDITGVTASSPLTGGGTSGDVTIGILSGTTSNLGAVQLSTSTSSTSTSLAATASAVKSAYDLANAAVPNSIVNAKGDLIGASANDTPAILSVGNNGETLVADSSTSTGLRYQGSQAAGRNAIINGNFDIWQRGTSFSINNNTAFTADRFVATVTNSMTLSRQTTGVPAGSQYCLRMASTFSNSVADFFQYIETANVVPLQGKTVTFSTRLRKNAANTSDAIILVQKSATTDAGSGASWTTISSTTVPTASLPTGTTSADWYLATLTISIPNDATANSLRVYISTSSQIANTAYLEIAQVSLEIGSVPTTFSRAGGTIQGELAACQRYYYRSTGYTNSRYSTGFNETTTNFIAYIKPTVTMRVTPTAVDYSNLQTYDGAFRTITNVTLVSAVSDSFCVNCTVSGVTANQSGVLNGSSASSFIGFSAEL